MVSEPILKLAMWWVLIARVTWSSSAFREHAIEAMDLEQPAMEAKELKQFPEAVQNTSGDLFNSSVASKQSFVAGTVPTDVEEVTRALLQKLSTKGHTAVTKDEARMLAAVLKVQKHGLPSLTEEELMIISETVKKHKQESTQNPLKTLLIFHKLCKEGVDALTENEIQISMKFIFDQDPSFFSKLPELPWMICSLLQVVLRILRAKEILVGIAFNHSLALPRAPQELIALLGSEIQKEARSPMTAPIKSMAQPVVDFADAAIKDALKQAFGSWLTQIVSPILSTCLTLGVKIAASQLASVTVKTAKQIVEAACPSWVPNNFEAPS